jgi:single-stranded DNA-binding protein
MSEFALITGAVFRAPEPKIALSGKPYASATVKVAADGEAIFWRVFAFSETAQAELMRLGDGDKIAAQGSIKLEVYTNKDGERRLSRTIFADHVLALRQPPRERKAKEKQKSVGGPDGTAEGGGREFDDEIPF